MSINSFHAYLFTFFFEDHRTSSTLTMYNASFVFELRTNISKIRSFLFYENNFSIRFYLFESEQWLRFRVASFFWISWEHSWWAFWWFDELIFRWWWSFKFQLTQSSRECEFHFWSLRWAFSNWRWRKSMSLDLRLIVFIRWFLWQLCWLLHCREFQHEREFNECEFLDRISRFYELMSATSTDQIVF